MSEVLTKTKNVKGFGRKSRDSIRGYQSDKIDSKIRFYWKSITFSELRESIPNLYKKKEFRWIIIIQKINRRNVKINKFRIFWKWKINERKTNWKLKKNLGRTDLINWRKKNGQKYGNYE